MRVHINCLRIYNKTLQGLSLVTSWQWTIAMCMQAFLPRNWLSPHYQVFVSGCLYYNFNVCVVCHCVHLHDLRQFVDWIQVISEFNKKNVKKLIFICVLVLQSPVKCKAANIGLVCNVQSAFRKPQAVNLLVVSDLTLDHSFKVT